MKITLFACLLFVTGSLFARNLDKTFQLLPQPQSVEVLSGKGLSFGELSYVSSAEGTSIPVLGEIVDGLPQSKRNGKGVRFQLSTTNVPDSPEGYVLEISDKGVTVTSRDNAGLFYGAQTLEQLLEDSRDFKKEIPSMKITDYPAIAYRAVHLDTKHHLTGWSTITVWWISWPVIK